MASADGEKFSELQVNAIRPAAAAAAAKSLQSCPSLHDFMDCSLLGFSIHGISQARVQCATRYYFKSKKFLA